MSASPVSKCRECGAWPASASAEGRHLPAGACPVCGSRASGRDAPAAARPEEGLEGLDPFAGDGGGADPAGTGGAAPDHDGRFDSAVDEFLALDLPDPSVADSRVEPPGVLEFPKGMSGAFGALPKELLHPTPESLAPAPAKPAPAPPKPPSVPAWSSAGQADNTPDTRIHDPGALASAAKAASVPAAKAATAPSAPAAKPAPAPAAPADDAGDGSDHDTRDNLKAITTSGKRPPIPGGPRTQSGFAPLEPVGGGFEPVVMDEGVPEVQPETVSGRRRGSSASNQPKTAATLPELKPDTSHEGRVFGRGKLHSSSGSPASVAISTVLPPQADGELAPPPDRPKKSASESGVHDPANDPLIGQQLGEYHIDKFAGAGGMATVYKSHDVRIGRTVALKVLLPDLAQRDPAALARLKREAQTSGNISHANVVTLYQVGRDKDRDFLVMEWVDGGNVQDHVAKLGPLPVADAVKIMIQACDGVAAAHNVGVIHRDIKPNNLMLTRDLVVKVADFGLAKQEQNDHTLTQQGSFLGTPQYMAPELWRGGDSSPKSDVYALGATLFYLLAGQAPFKGTVYTLVLSHTQRPIPNLNKLRKDLPGELLVIISKAMAKTPEERYINAGEMAAALRALPASALTGRPDGGKPTVDSAAFDAQLEDLQAGDMLVPAGGQAKGGGVAGWAAAGLALLAGILGSAYFAFREAPKIETKDDPYANNNKNGGNGGTTVTPPVDPDADVVVVDVNVSPPTAKLALLGRREPPAGFPATGMSGARRLRLPPGDHTLVVSHPGHVSEVRLPAGKAGTKLRMDVSLRPLEQAYLLEAGPRLAVLEKTLVEGLAARDARRLADVIRFDPARPEQRAGLDALIQWAAPYARLDVSAAGGSVGALGPGRIGRKGAVSLTLVGSDPTLQARIVLPDPLPLVRTGDGWRFAGESFTDLVPKPWRDARTALSAFLPRMGDWASPGYEAIYADPRQAAAVRSMAEFLAAQGATGGEAGSLKFEQALESAVLSGDLTRAVIRVRTRLHTPRGPREEALLEHALTAAPGAATSGNWRVLSTARVSE